MNISTFVQRTIQFKHEFSFEAAALELFAYQAAEIPIYRQFIQSIHRSPDKVRKLTDIPFLPIQFFKTHEVSVGGLKSNLWFESSGTTGAAFAKRNVVEKHVYEQSFLTNFIERYGHPREMKILALLPNYLERKRSSLVYMVEFLIKCGAREGSGFYLHNLQELHEELERSRDNNIPTLLFGVTFAMLDFVHTFPMEFPGLIVVETGGMKGRGKEPTKLEVHRTISEGLVGCRVETEYGMTEMYSQAYGTGELMETPPWMCVLRREVNDPFAVTDEPGRGVLNVIDLANVDSCSFLATDDLIRLETTNKFETLGRLDQAEIRGCNLLYTT